MDGAYIKMGDLVNKQGVVHFEYNFEQALFPCKGFT